ncbi:MAG: hypothetical protein L0Z62_19515, partial [Gemmataceae bacterium]|nr:hypothetical protein [Gemmataceae bacterium]
VEQRLNLGAALIRMQKYREAAEVLRPAHLKARGNFFVLANLGMAEFLDAQASGQTALQQRGLDNLEAALFAWRKWEAKKEYRTHWLAQVVWQTWLTRMGCDEARLEQYRRAQDYLRKLFRLRSRPRPTPPGGASSLLGEDIEALFTGGAPPRPVRFVGADGKYQAGALAPEEAKKLPADAVDIVQQLLLWMPHDHRLYWLLGELYNARGEYATAYKIFDEIGGLMQVLKRGNEAFGVETPRLYRWELAQKKDREYRELPQLQRAHWQVIREAKEKADKDLLQADAAPKDKPPPPPVRPPPPPKVATDDTFPIDLRSLGVGFGGGVIVAIFGYWQVREVRRRRQARATVPSSNEGGPHWSGPKDAITARPPEGKPG